MTLGLAPQDGRGGGWRPSIGTVLTVGFGVLVFAAVAAVLWVSLGAARQNTLTLTRDKAELVVASIIERTESHLGAAEHQLTYLADMIGADQLDPSDDAAMTEMLLVSIAAAPAITGIAFIAEDMQAIRAGRQYGSFARFKSDWSHRSGIREMMESMRDFGKLRWNGVHWVEDLREPHVAAALPLYKGDRFLGVLTSVVSIRALSRFLLDIDEAHGTHSFILQERDRVVAHPALIGFVAGLDESRPMPDLDEINDPRLVRIWDPALDNMPTLLAESAVQGHVIEGRDEQLIFIYREVEGYGPHPWLIGTYFREGEVGTEMRRLMIAAVTGLAILLAALIAAYFLGRAISRPVRRLATASRAIGELDFRAVQALGHSPFRELDSAASAYNSMLNGLRWFETYVPRSLVLRLMHQGAGGVQSEERQVTVIFTDIVGFTAMSAELSAPALADFLNAHFTLLGACIEAEEGTVDKYIGDSVMAFWGAPSDQPDHAARACRSVQAIAEAIAADNAARAAKGLPPVRLRIGIHSGKAIVGNIGAPGRINYTLVGDTVNSAQRLEGLAREYYAGQSDVTVLLSGDTKALLESEFPVEDLGAHQLRGRQTETEVYRLLVESVAL